MGLPLPAPRRWPVPLMGLGLLVAGTVALLLGEGRHRLDGVSPEAVVLEAVCQHVLDSTTVGRQAMVSSVWHPPLPVLLRLPLVAAVGSESCPLSSMAVSAFCGILSLLVLHRILRKWGVGRLRWILLAAVALNPFFVRGVFDGSSGTTALVLLLISVHGLAAWVTQRQIRALVYIGGGVALMAVTCFEVSLWMMLAFPLLLAHEWVRRSARDERHATLILALTPAAYVLGLWVLMNWLIMGDSRYFLRSLFSPACPREPYPLRLAGLAPYWAAAAVSVVAAVAARLRGDRCGMCVGGMGLAAFVGLVMLAPRGLAWDPDFMWLCVFVTAVLAVARGTVSAGDPQRLRLGAAAVPLLLTAIALAQGRGGGRMGPEGGDFRRLTGERDREMPRIASHVLSRSRYAKVFVCGYDSFLLLPPGGDALFLPALDFNFNKAKDDYRGHMLFLLVHRPVGRGAMDSIHWKFPGIFALGTRSTLYEGDWGEWRLFEIIEPARRRGP